MAATVTVCTESDLAVSKANTVCACAGGKCRLPPQHPASAQPGSCSSKRKSSYKSEGTPISTPTCTSWSTVAYTTPGAASGSTPSNCIIGRAIPRAQDPDAENCTMASQDVCKRFATTRCTASIKLHNPPQRMTKAHPYRQPNYLLRNFREDRE